MRYHQLQSRLATLKIENEEVRIDDARCPVPPKPPHPPVKYRRLCLIFPRARRRATSPSVLIAITPNVTLLCGSQEYIYTVTMPIFPFKGGN